MLHQVLPLLACPCCRQMNRPLTVHAFRKDDREVLDGVLRCPDCNASYPIVDRLLELVPPPLLDVGALDQLEGAYPAELAAIGWVRPAGAGTAASRDEYSEQMKQREHFDGYADGLLQKYDDYANMPFWRVTDDWTFERWHQLIQPGALLLDIGCADGRSAFPHIGRNTVVGFDISRKMIRRAIDRAIRENQAGTCCFFVSDGSMLPFKSDSFPYVQTYGVLHHLPNPGAVAQEIQRVLRPDGIHFASENNETVFRKIFDVMMKVMPIWHEEAGEEALISRKMAEGWVSGLRTRLESETIVFMPPHAFNLFPKPLARKMLDVTNRVFGAVPLMKRNGGLIVFRIHKTAA